MERTFSQVEEFRKQLERMTITEILMFMSDRELGDWGFLAMVRDELETRINKR